MESFFKMLCKYVCFLKIVMSPSSICKVLRLSDKNVANKQKSYTSEFNASDMVSSKLWELNQ
jgi:hypothetical protein